MLTPRIKDSEGSGFDYSQKDIVKIVEILPT